MGEDRVLPRCRQRLPQQRGRGTPDRYDAGAGDPVTRAPALVGSVAKETGVHTAIILGLQSNHMVINPWLLFDADLAWTHARYAHENENDEVGTYIPNAVSKVGSAGLPAHHLGAWSGGIKLLYIGGYPLSQDGSLRAPSSTVTNLRMQSTGNHYRRAVQRVAPSKPTLYPASRSLAVALLFSTSSTIRPINGTNSRIIKMTLTASRNPDSNKA